MIGAFLGRDGGQGVGDCDGDGALGVVAHTQTVLAASANRERWKWIKFQRPLTCRPDVNRLPTAPAWRARRHCRQGRQSKGSFHRAASGIPQ
jgi:hypothetical protein